MTRPLILSLGDPAGIGPELACLAWCARQRERLPAFAIMGGAAVLADAAARIGLDCPIARIDALAQASDAFTAGLPVLGEGAAPYSPGKPSKEGARLALASLEDAVGRAVAGEASGVVTGPVSKAQLAEVGFAHPGQTEYLASACGMSADEAVMMLASPTLRTVPLTVHCALSSVPGLLSTALIVARGRTVARSLRRDFGVAEPRLAIAALNPHAGEGGRFGDEEARIIAPAIEALRADGTNAFGPQPADAMFTPRARPTYDAALCMYHDQALVPLKALDFDAGVNVTLGLPIVRTSADHGTAFDIAGKGLADPGATIAAIRMAGEIAARRADG